MYRSASRLPRGVPAIFPSKFNFQETSISTQRSDRSALARPKNRAGLCSFTFADGRHCLTPRSSTHPHLCYCHARKEAQARAADEIGSDISYFFSGPYLSASDLRSALARLFSGVVQGQIKPKMASTLTYLSQTLLQAIQLAQHEHISAFGSLHWRDTVHSSVNDNWDRISEDSNQDQTAQANGSNDDGQDECQDEIQIEAHSEDHGGEPEEEQSAEKASTPKTGSSNN